MIAIPRNFDEALDIVWGVIKENNDRWDNILPGTLGITRNHIASELGWSYSTVHRLCEYLEKTGQVSVKWNHQHQSYWEAHYSITAPGKEG